MIRDIKAGLMVLAFCLALLVLVVLALALVIVVIWVLGSVVMWLLPPWAYKPFIASCWLFILVLGIGKLVRS